MFTVMKEPVTQSNSVAHSCVFISFENNAGLWQRGKKENEEIKVTNPSCISRQLMDTDDGNWTVASFDVSTPVIELLPVSVFHVENN